MRDEGIERSEEFSGPLDLPDEYGSSEEEGASSGPSLTDDIFALIDDGKIYAEAEVAFQKSRAGYAANRAAGAVAFGLGAFGVFHLALIAATVGVVIALVPLVGPWIATGIVTFALLVAGFILLRLLKGRIDDIRSAFEDTRE